MGTMRSIFCALAALLAAAGANPSVFQWGVFEVTLQSSTPQHNPFTDVSVFATFTSIDGYHAPVRVRGFFDGVTGASTAGNAVLTYRVRFMPPVSGKWQWESESTGDSSLGGQRGTLNVNPLSLPQMAGRSPVRVKDVRSFEHADGTSHVSVGTTSYAWIHQNDTMIANTEKTLADPATPFNKMRMTVFPKWYIYNRVEPEFFPYQRKDTDQAPSWDFTAFNVSFWQRLDARIASLQASGVQADIILFHPYDNGHWGFDCMGGPNASTYDTANDERYLQYVVARLGAYHNVWWSMANEWDLVKCKGEGVADGRSPTWDRLFKVLAAEDPYHHLTSIHNCVRLYNHSKPWITHISSQGGYDMAHIKRKYAPKPIVWDEVMYEGDIGMWGGLTAGQMTDRYWWGLSYGIYVGHGETVLTAKVGDDDQVLWWSKGNVLRGESPPRIAWFADQARSRGWYESITCSCTGWGGQTLCDDSCLGTYKAMGDGMNLVTDEQTWFLLHSSAYNNPSHGPDASTIALPAGKWEVLPVDTWNMQVLPSVATLTGGGSSSGGVQIAASLFTAAKQLTSNETLAPCKRSSASCCASDTEACTPYTLLLTKVAEEKQEQRQQEEEAEADVAREITSATATAVAASAAAMKKTNSGGGGGGGGDSDDDDDAWAALRSGVEAWAALSFDADFAVQVGDAKGSRFLYTTPGFSMSTSRLAGASLSKWPSAVMISGLVADGTMSFDDKANKYLTWWATDPSDPRSRVTLKHLLSFTSGFTEDPSQLYMCAGSFVECAEKAYKGATKYEAPGTTWRYLSCHLQFAGAMAVAAANQAKRRAAAIRGSTNSNGSGNGDDDTDVGIQDLFAKYLYRPFNMTGTTWGPKNNPSMAGGITTTGDDFANMLQRLLTYSVLPKAIVDVMETDWSQAPVAPSGDGWFGHYGMGHWWECLGYGTPDERAKLPEVCLASHIQAGPGEFGYYPLIDRSGGAGAAGPERPHFWMQVVLQEPDALSGIPEYLRLLTKPVADIIMSGGDPAKADRQALLDQGGGLITRDITYIQSELLKCSCSKTGAFQRGEPFKSLISFAKLPADKAGVNRRALAGQGIGLTLADVAAAQPSIGTCTCKGRKKKKMMSGDGEVTEEEEEEEDAVALLGVAAVKRAAEKAAAAVL